MLLTVISWKERSASQHLHKNTADRPHISLKKEGRENRLNQRNLRQTFGEKKKGKQASTIPKNGHLFVVWAAHNNLGGTVPARLHIAVDGERALL